MQRQLKDDAREIVEEAKAVARERVSRDIPVWDAQLHIRDDVLQLIRLRIDQKPCVTATELQAIANAIPDNPIKNIRSEFDVPGKFTADFQVTVPRPADWIVFKLSVI